MTLFGNSTRRMIGLGVGLGLSVAALLLVAPVAEAQAEEAGGKVTICHFTDHQGAYIGDFVTRSTKAAGNLLCEALGGDGIEVSEVACENGHNAAPFNFPILFPGETYTCQDGDKQLGLVEQSLR